MAKVDLSNLNSKKFIAYMAADATWTALLLAGLYWLQQILVQKDGAAIVGQAGLVSLLFAMVLVKGFLQTAYIGTTAWLDRYVKVAEIAADQFDGDGNAEEKVKPSPVPPPTTTT